MSFSRTYFSLLWIIFTFQSPLSALLTIITQDSERLSLCTMLTEVSESSCSVTFEHPTITLTVKTTNNINLFLFTFYLFLEITFSIFLYLLDISTHKIVSDKSLNTAIFFIYFTLLSPKKKFMYHIR